MSGVLVTVMDLPYFHFSDPSTAIFRCHGTADWGTYEINGNDAEINTSKKYSKVCVVYKKKLIYFLKLIQKNVHLLMRM